MKSCIEARTTPLSWTTTIESTVRAFRPKTNLAPSGGAVDAHATDRHRVALADHGLEAWGSPRRRSRRRPPHRPDAGGTNLAIRIAGDRPGVHGCGSGSARGTSSPEASNSVTVASPHSTVTAQIGSSARSTVRADRPARARAGRPGIDDHALDAGANAPRRRPLGTSVKTPAATHLRLRPDVETGRGHAVPRPPDSELVWSTVGRRPSCSSPVSTRQRKRSVEPDGDVGGLRDVGGCWSPTSGSPPRPTTARFTAIVVAAARPGPPPRHQPPPRPDPSPGPDRAAGRDRHHPRDAGTSRPAPGACVAEVVHDVPPPTPTERRVAKARAIIEFSARLLQPRRLRHPVPGDPRRSAYDGGALPIGERLERPPHLVALGGVRRGHGAICNCCFASHARSVRRRRSDEENRFTIVRRRRVDVVDRTQVRTSPQADEGILDQILGLVPIARQEVREAEAGRPPQACLLEAIRLAAHGRRHLDGSESSTTP